MAEEAKTLRARLAELEEASKTKVSKVRARRRTAFMKVVAEKAHMKRAEHTGQIAQLESNLYRRKDKLDFSECSNIVADLWYFTLSDECDSLRNQTARGSV